MIGKIDSIVKLGYSRGDNRASMGFIDGADFAAIAGGM